MSDDSPTAPPLNEATSSPAENVRAASEAFVASAQALREDLQRASAAEGLESIDTLKALLAGVDETVQNQRDVKSRQDQIINGLDLANDLGRKIRHQDDELGSEIVKLRSEIMGRMDRLQDALSKQALEMQAVIELLKDSSPAELLLRIRQQDRGNPRTQAQA